MSDAPCIIPPNPDVSGIGVRAAIYAQNLACFVLVIVHLWDGKISAAELKGIKDQSIGMLAVAFAMLFTTIILAKGAGGDQTITSYHAAVVLDLSWMNNISTWIWFILYIHYQSKRGHKPVGANWDEWCTALLEPVQKPLERSDGGDSEEEGSIIKDRYSEETASINADSNLEVESRILRWTRSVPRGIARPTPGITKPVPGVAKRLWHALSVQPVLTLALIHFSLMAAVGIQLWSAPSKFGEPLNTQLRSHPYDYWNKMSLRFAPAMEYYKGINSTQIQHRMMPKPVRSVRFMEIIPYNRDGTAKLFETLQEVEVVSTVKYGYFD